MGQILPGTEVVARGLRWEVVFTEPAGDQELYRLRCLDEQATQLEVQAERPSEEPRKASLMDKARELRKRVEDLPDPDDDREVTA